MATDPSDYDIETPADLEQFLEAIVGAADEHTDVTGAYTIEPDPRDAPQKVEILITEVVPE
jgi:hypothetical protein